MRIVPIFVLTVFVAACGGSSMSLTEYAEEVEAIVARVGSNLDRLDAERSSGAATVASEQRYWEGRVAARHRFLDEFGDLDPPEEVRSLHETALVLLTDVTKAEETVADRAREMESPADIDRLWQGPEVAAWRALDLQSMELCNAAQAELDATSEREAFEGNLWVPPQLKEVVSVAFGCTPEQRRTGG